MAGFSFEPGQVGRLLTSYREVHALPTARHLDWFDIVHAAAIPLLPDAGAVRRGEVFACSASRQAASCDDHLGALEGGLPFVLAASDEDDLARLVSEPGGTCAQPPPRYYAELRARMPWLPSPRAARDQCRAG